MFWGQSQKRANAYEWKYICPNVSKQRNIAFFFSAHMGIFSRFKIHPTYFLARMLQNITCMNIISIYIYIDPQPLLILLSLWVTLTIWLCYVWIGETQIVGNKMALDAVSIWRSRPIGIWISIKMETVLRPSYLCNGNQQTWKNGLYTNRRPCIMSNVFHNTQSRRVNHNHND